MSATAPRLDITYDELTSLLDATATRTAIYAALGCLDGMRLEGDEIAALKKMPIEYQVRIKAQLLDYAEGLRDYSRDLDAQIMALTGDRV